MDKKGCLAIVLAAGQGSRMKSKTLKQFIELKGKPLIYYSLQAFQNCEFIDDIILVTGADNIAYCQNEIVDIYHFSKVSAVVTGGRERYHSVYEGLRAAGHCEYVFIHDGARPFISKDILLRAYETVKEHRACVVGMPVKDTIKVVDQNQWATHTPDRDTLWQIQTPQVFDYSLIKQAYDVFMRVESASVTDDAMVMERYGNHKVKLVEGSYDNIKITTPEDIAVAEVFYQNRECKK